MRSASGVFYLAVFALLRPSRGDSRISKSSSHSPSVCAIDPKAIVSDACASFAMLDDLNDQISPLLTSITQDTDFFSYYRLNLFKKGCPFWSDDTGICANIACAVSTLDSEEDIPPIWRAKELSKLEGPKARHPGKQLQQERPKEKPLQGMLGEDVGESCVVEYDDECDERDYCIPEDEGATAKGDYVSLVNNPERFTGYAGPGARQVWEAIYRENCFLKPLLESATSPNLLPLGNLQAARDFRNVLEKRGRERAVTAASRNESYPLDNGCVEKRVFHHLVSGMHASISAHLCWDYFNQTTGQWVPNLQCYKERLHDHPERISNLYFDFALLVRAVAKLQKHLQTYSFCSSDPEQDYDTREKVLLLVDQVLSKPQIFDETIMFKDPSGINLKEDFRNRFRNVSRLMDCIGCDKCRLWGKLQTAGYGAALKVLFEFDENKNGENPPLRRTELVALVNTLGRVSKSLAVVQNFETALESGTVDRLAVHTTVPKVPQQQGVGEPKEQPGQAPEKSDDQGICTDERDEREDTCNKPSYVVRDNFMDNFWEEWHLVWRTFAYVIRSWVNFPKTAWDILIMETTRLWNYWLGLPVPPRSWKIEFPSRNEL